MERRDFIKSLGIAGTFSLAGALCHRTACAQRRAPASEGPSRQSKTSPHSFLGPFDVAFDRAGRLLVTDSPGYRVLCIDRAAGSISSFGKPGAVIGRFNYPRGITVGSDELLYVVDSNNCRIQCFAGHGEVKRVFGSIGSIGGSLANPQGIHIDEKGRVFVADTRNHRVQIFEHFQLAAVLGDLGDADDQFRLPTACITRRDEILVLDSKHGLVKIFGDDLKFRVSFGGVGGAPGQLNMPQGMELGPDGSVWVADTGNHRLQVFSAEGKLDAVLGKQGSGIGEFQSPAGLAWHEGSMYVADTGNRRIHVIRDKVFEIVEV